MRARPSPRTAAVVLVAAGIAVLGAAAPAPAATDVAAQRRAIAALERDLARIDAEAGAAAVAHNRALDRRDAIRGRIRTTRTAIARTRRELLRSQEVLSRRLVQVYVEGVPGPIDVLMQSGSLADALAVGTLLQHSAEADAAAVAGVRDRRRALEELRARLARDARAADAALRAARAERARMEALLAARRRALAGARSELGRLLAAQRARLARLAAQKRAARTAARRASEVPAPPAADPHPPEAAAPGASQPAAPAGSHVFPIAGPSTFSDDWLASRAGGRYHEGIDLFAARGTPVVAVADGTLFRVGYSGISGYRLWLRDGAGTEFFYAHLDGYAPAAGEGAFVRKGTVIGYNGDSGDAKGTSPHVHFEIHPGGGGPVRPYPIVSAWPRIG